MNDCIFCFIDGCCAECNGRCDKYVSANEDKGAELLAEYELEVRKALEPVQKNFKEKYFN